MTAPARQIATAQMLTGGRLHLQDGPIDLVIKAEGTAEEVREAYAQAIAAFDGLLAELACELPELRRALGKEPHRLRHPVAQAMLRACRPHAALWVTPMAAVAGAVADHILTAATAGRRLSRVWVNNGGDIALYLTPGTNLDIGLVTDLADWGPTGHLTLTHDLPARGLATSGRQGRSLSRGLAEAVTVLARTAAEADVAATLIANAVDLEGHPCVLRRPACEIDRDSDLQTLPVVTAVGPLSAEEVETALAAGAKLATEMQAAGLIQGALLSLRGRARAIPDRHGETRLSWT